jgi:alpha-beta hydrolase superfamily lysophospholipase
MTNSASRLKFRPGKFLIGGFLISGAFYLLICAGCAGYQRRMIYFPPVFDQATADKLGAEAGLERWLDPNGLPVGWKRLASTQPAAGRVLITYGNGSCAVGCAHYADVIQSVAAMDVFILEYPGYGDRRGQPSEVALEKAADVALEALPKDGPTYLMGESLGTGVACHLAGTYSNRVAGVILLAPFNSLTAVAQAHAPVLPVKLILCDRFSSEKFLKSYAGPIAILVGGEDRVVPEKFGRRLYNGYAGPKRLWEFPHGNHGTVMLQPPEIWKQILDFVVSSRQDHS